ncbi:hypothetical protein [Clostridium polynesiense]|uniref:hypothetical protein n=1 Tax=Clostridium polynesiense TaxID=1325933 RepID=UPI0005917AB2|nr:hypothetical protein [Clostridium polynesiense]
MSIEQRKAVGLNCPGYEPINKGLVSEAGPERSCDNCRHFVEKRCDIDLYDKVLIGRNPW